MAASAKTRLNDALRRRELSSSDRAARFARRKAWDQQLSYARRLSYRLVVVALGAPVACIPVMLALPEPWRWILLGLVVASGLWGVGVFVLLNSGAANTLLGAGGEEMTAIELQPLRRRGWRVVHGLLVRERWDIDHVAVGPGGVLVFETKRSGDAWPVGVPGKPFMVDALNRAVRQARDNTRDVTREFGDVLNGAPVRAVVVAWSSVPEVDGGPGWKDYGSVTVVHGRSLGLWLQTLDGPAVLDQEGIERIWTAVSDRASIGDGSQPPSRPTIQQLIGFLWQICAGVLAAVYALIGLDAAGLFRSWGILVVPAAGVALGLRGRRYKPIRWAADAWTAVFGVALVVLLVALGVFALT